MGALEYKPVIADSPKKPQKLEVQKLVALSNQVLNDRENVVGRLTAGGDVLDIESILHVGTSAGGTRAKAVLAWNEETDELKSGQVEAGKGYTYWLMKFDGVDENKDRELADPRGIYADSDFLMKSENVSVKCLG